MIDGVDNTYILDTIETEDFRTDIAHMMCDPRLNVEFRNKWVIVRQDNLRIVFEPHCTKNLHDYLRVHFSTSVPLLRDFKTFVAFIDELQSQTK